MGIILLRLAKMNSRVYDSEKSTFYPLIQFENKAIVCRGPLATVDTDIVIYKCRRKKNYFNHRSKWSRDSPFPTKKLLLNYS